jgi:hypothetical protein
VAVAVAAVVVALNKQVLDHSDMYLEVWYEPFTKGTQQLEQQVDVIWMVTEEVQQDLDNEFRLLPMLVIHRIHLPMELLPDRQVCGTNCFYHHRNTVFH